MIKSKPLLVISFLLFFLSGLSQNPKPVLQKSFDSGIEDIKISPDKSHFITLEGGVQTIGGFDIKLWDYDSKIIITQQHFEGENGIGSGKFELLNNGVVIFSKNHSITKFNLLTKEQENIFKVEWPEFIHNFTTYNNANFIVSTKIYSEKENSVYDITNTSSLYVLEEKSVKAKLEHKFEIPTLTFDSKSQTVIIGNNKGEAYFYDLNLNEAHTKLEFFKKKAISFLHLTNDGFLFANPALPFEKKGYSPDLKEGLFKILNINDVAFNKTVELPKQNAPENKDEYSLIEFHPSNIVKDIIVNKGNLVISYGFSKLGFLDLKSFELSEKGPENVDYDIGKIYINPNSDEIVYSYGAVQMISNASNLAVYNTNFERNTFEFKQKTEVLEKTKSLIRINSDFYFAEKHSVSYNEMDSIVFQSPITQETKTLKCDDCQVLFNTRNKNWVVSDFNGNIFIGTPNKSFIKNPQTILNFDFDTNYNQYLVQNKLFDNGRTINLDLENKKYYPEIIDYFEHSNTFLTTLKYVKGDSQLGVINNDGSIKTKFGKKKDIKYTISNNGKFLAIANRNSKIEVYNTKDWNLLLSQKYKIDYGPSDLAFDYNDEYLYYQEPIINEEGVNTFGFFEIQLKNVTNSIKQIHQNEFYNNFFVDRKYNSIYLNDGNYVKQINYKTQNTSYQKTGGFAGKPSYYSKDIDKIIVDSGEYLSVFNRGTDTSAEIYFFPENHYITITHEGYYMMSPNFPLENFGFAIGSNGYSFSQFDLLYNRPDKVLEFLGFLKQEEVNLFKSAYKKRLAQQDIKIEAISTNISDLPMAEIKLSNTSFSTQQKDYTINVSFNDTANTLKTYNIWINGVPVFGSNGKNINDNLNTLQTEVRLELSKENNKIEVSCINDKGLESLRKSVNVFYDTKKEKGNLIFVGIGVSKYQDSTYNLTYASKDVKDMSTYMQSLKSKYNSVDIITLLDREVTTENVSAIKQRLSNTTIEDKVVMFYAGHGLLDKNYDYFISTHNINFDNPIDNGLAYKDLEGLLDNIPARQKLLLIDACHSGEIDKESISTIETDFDASHIKLGFRGSKAVSVKDEKIQNAFVLMQNTFSDLRLGTGTTVISSSSGLEFAYEGEEWNNGVFTYALLEGLKSGNSDINNDNSISISEIKTYVSKKVNILTNGKQKPNARSLNLELDWSLF